VGDQVPYEVGDRVYPGTTIIKVVDQMSMQLEATINQAESSTFRVGQEAEIRLDAYPDAKYPGKVSAIGALGVAPGRQQYFIRTIPIRLRIGNPDNRLIPDLSGSADILLQREANTLIIPASAVEYENGKAFVRVPAAQGYLRKQVTVGLISGPQISIQSGLNEGDSVIIN
jgi:multidrug efflux pump subunit AcrA (membrane-fusion protein)